MKPETTIWDYSALTISGKTVPMASRRTSLFGASSPASTHKQKSRAVVSNSLKEAFEAQKDFSHRPETQPNHNKDYGPSGLLLLSGKPSRLKKLPFTTSMGLSLFTHASAPLLTVALWTLLTLLLLWLFNINLDLSQLFPKPKTQTPEIEFVLVQNKNAQRPEEASFKGEFNQQAGGKKNDETPAPFETPTKASAQSPQAKPSPQKVSPSPSPKPTPARNPSPPKQLVRKSPPTPKKPQQKQPPKPKLPKLVASAIKTPVVAPKPSSQVKNTPQQSKSPQQANQNPSPAVNPQQATTGPSSQFKTASQALASMGATGLAPNLTRGAAQEGASKNAGVNVQASPDFGPYMAELKRRLARNWRPPRGKQSKRVVIRFDIKRDGQVGNIWVEKSSGTTMSDTAALDAVKVSAPFKPLPPSFGEEAIPILFTFDYTIYGLSKR